jgi:histidyl-tRNA synthetase
MPERALPGFRDFYPQDLAERNYIIDTWRRVATRFGFQEYDGPPLEPLELYTRKSGEEIVGQLYNFTDKGGREVALRPEMTPTFARMVAARANALRKPVRWFSVPQLFRYERQQKGRLREHFQLNVDLVGEADVTADAELAAVAVEIMRELGLGPEDVRVRVSDRRLLNAVLYAVGCEERQLPVVYAVVDKAERESAETLSNRLSAGGVEAATAARLFTVLRKSRGAEPEALLGIGNAPDAAMEQIRESVTQFRRYMNLVRALGAGEWIQFDLSIVRGLGYYTGTVFELFDARGQHRAICGGGRYDTLLSALGGVDLPALGFGMGDVVLGELLRERGLMRAATGTLDYWVAADSADLLTDVMRVATALRRVGHSVEYSLREQALGRQLKAAASAGAASAVLLRQELWPQGRIVLREMGSGTEQTLDRESWKPIAGLS